MDTRKVMSLIGILIFVIVHTARSRSLHRHDELNLVSPCSPGQHIDSRRDGFYRNFNVTIRSHLQDEHAQRYVSNAMALRQRDTVVITSVSRDEVFNIEEICVETKGVGGIFWEFEEPAPPPKVSRVGASWFVSAVGGALHHMVTPVLDSSIWDASCVAFDRALDRLTLTPMGIDNTAASIRQLRITGCISPAEQEL